MIDFSPKDKMAAPKHSPVKKRFDYLISLKIGAREKTELKLRHGTNLFGFADALLGSEEKLA